MAVYGEATATTGTAYGVYGIADSTGGGASGVYGRGNTGGAFSGVATGVYGTCTGSGCNGLVISGNAYISGTLTCGVSCNSDARLKQHIEPLTGAVDKIMQLRGVTFEWKNPAEHENHTGTQTGLIAQEVQKVFPQWVHETDKGVLNVDVDPRTMAALTVESIRALQMENNELRHRLDALERDRRPLASGYNFGMGVGIFGVAIAGALVFTRKKRSEPRT
jgi:hypothetical protein